MSSTSVLIDLIGAVALLIWGLGALRKGMERAFGSKMRVVLEVGTSNRGRSFGVGFLTTLVLQSSTATAIMTSSFVEQKLVALNMALAIILGANVGTSLVSQLVSLKIQWLAPVCLFIGLVIPRFSKGTRGQGIGLSFAGLGLMLLSLKLMNQATLPLRDSEILRILFSLLGDAPLFAVIASAMLACIAASSLAVVLFVMSLYQVGAISPVICVLFVVGANIGGAIPPLFVVGKDQASRQVILGDLFMRGIGVILVIIFASLIEKLLVYVPIGPRFAVDVHVAFNILMAIIYIPLLDPVAKIVQRFAPIHEEEDVNKPKFLDESILSTPMSAITAARRETMRIGDTVERMLEISRKMLRSDNDEHLYTQIQQMDDKVDRLQEAVKQYIFRLNRKDLNESQKQQITEIISYAINLEHVGDIIDKNLIKDAQKKDRDHLVFSDEGFAEIEILYIRTIENLQLAQTVFMTHDPQMARKLVESKVEIRQMEIDSVDKHLKRYRDGIRASIQSSSLHLDVLRDLKRINAHLVTVAYPILSQMGVLRESRLSMEQITDKRIQADEEQG